MSLRKRDLIRYFPTPDPGSQNGQSSFGILKRSIQDPIQDTVDPEVKMEECGLTYDETKKFGFAKAERSILESSQKIIEKIFEHLSGKSNYLPMIVSESRLKLIPQEKTAIKEENSFS